ncbi:hypothetical protein BDQ17DRAFT_1258793, partial [Cyathus striatus]
KEVKTIHDWSTAWIHTSSAMCYVFPHRTQELQRYGEYIIRIFNSVPAEDANYVITFDFMCRAHTAGKNNNIRLCDFEQFRELKIAVFSQI